MAIFEVLYGRLCRLPIEWFDAFEVSHWGTNMIEDSTKKVRFMQKELLAAYS